MPANLNIQWPSVSAPTFDASTAANTDYNRLKEGVVGAATAYKNYQQKKQERAEKEKKDAANKAYADILRKKARVAEIQDEITRLESQDAALQKKIDEAKASVPKEAPLQLDQPLRFNNPMTLEPTVVG